MFKYIVNFFVKRRKEFLLLFNVILYCFIILELVSRIILPDTVFHGQPMNKYGWILPANTLEIKTVIYSKDYIRNVTINYSNNGFKRWGNVDTNKTKLFILGDSFTEMEYVSNGEEYYAYLEDTFNNLELFVLGIGGYSSLQEFMVLDYFFDIIKPDLILWQFSYNDYRSNLWAYEKKIFPFSANQIRPYLEGNKIVYRFPGPLNWLRKYSKFIDFLMERYQLLWKRSSSLSQFYGELKKKIDKKKVYAIDRIEALNVTMNILCMAKKRAGDIPFFLFSVDEIGSREKFICSKANLTCIHGISKYLNEKERAGINTTILDSGHWNVAGNEAVGRFLVDYFKNKSYFII